MCKNILLGVIREQIVPALQHGPAITFKSKSCKLITVFANSISLFTFWIFSSIALSIKIETLQDVHLRQAFLTAKNMLIIIF